MEQEQVTFEIVSSPELTILINAAGHATFAAGTWHMADLFAQAITAEQPLLLEAYNEQRSKILAWLDTIAPV